MTKKIILSLTISILIFSYLAKSNDLAKVKALFYNANTNYSQESIDQAILEYQGVLSLGFESGELYYNLGNAYFKKGLLGKAILNYLRAKRLIPEDADLKSNLKYAQSLIKSTGPVKKQGFILGRLFKLAGLFSLDKITVIVSIIYFFLAGLIILLIITKRFKKPLKYAIGTVFIIFMVFLTAFYLKVQQISIRSKAVVMAENLDSKFEPFNEATTFFTLEEGQSVWAISSKGDWFKVKRSDGKQGWVKKDGIELL